MASCMWRPAGEEEGMGGVVTLSSAERIGGVEVPSAYYI